MDISSLPDALDLFVCLGSAAPAHLRLWRPYIHSGPINSGEAAINAIEKALETAWARDLGDAEGVGCTLKCQNMMQWELQKDGLNTDWLFGAIGWERLGEGGRGGNEGADDSGVTNFDRGWGGAGDGGEEGSCCKGQDLHVWS